MKRDFTFIEDIVEGITKCSLKFAYQNTNFDRLLPDASSSTTPQRIFNIGNGKPIKKLFHSINLFEKELVLESKKDYQYLSLFVEFSK